MKMDANYLLIWLVVASCVIGLAGLVRGQPPGDRHWAGPLAGIGLVMAIGYWRAPGAIGYIGGAMWLLFVIVPAMGFRQLQRLAALREYGRARAGYAWLRWLHPARDWHYQAEMWRALELGTQGRRREALALLTELEQTPPPTGELATVYYLMVDNRWSTLRQLLAADFAGEGPGPRAELLPYYLRALGETGDLAGLVETYARHAGWLDRQGQRTHRALCQLTVAAFCGRADLVPPLLREALGAIPPAWQMLWLWTAHQAAGASVTGQRLLERLKTDTDWLLGELVAWRLQHPPATPSASLQPVHWEMLRNLEMEVEYELFERAQLTAPPQRHVAIYVLIGLNVAMWLLEVFHGGSRNTYTIVSLGGLYAPYVIEGEWWRVPAAIFLHFGFVHLAVNMLGLWVFGPFVIGMLGVARFVLVYLLTGLGSMVVLVAANTLMENPQLVVGASGCIMGLVGAIGAIFWRTWRRSGGREAKQRLLLIGMIVSFQAAFDLTTPEVSFLAHLSGAMLGLLVTLFLKHRTDSLLPPVPKGVAR